MKNLSRLNRFVSQVVLSKINNEKLFQIIHLKKLGENDFLLPKIMKFKKFYDFEYIQKYPNKLSLEFFIWANKFTHFDIIFDTYSKYIYDKYDTYKDTFNFICLHGHLDIVKWFVKNKIYNFGEKSIDYAAKGGHLDVVEFLHKNRKNTLISGTSKTIEYLVENSRLDIISLMHKNMHYLSNFIQEDTLKNLIFITTRNGKLSILISLLTRLGIDKCNYKDRIDILNCAAGYGHLDIIKWCCENFDLNNKTNVKLFSDCVIDNAAARGYLDIVKYLCENEKVKDMYSIWAINFAAGKGYLDIVKFLFEHMKNMKDTSDGFTMYAVNSAVEKGHLHIVKYFYEKYSYMQNFHLETHLIRASSNGRFDIVNYLYLLKKRN